MGATGRGVGGELGTEGAAPSNRAVGNGGVGNGVGGVVVATASEMACQWEANRREASVSLVSVVIIRNNWKLLSPNILVHSLELKSGKSSGATFHMTNLF